MAEHLIRNEAVGGSTPPISSRLNPRVFNGSGVFLVSGDFALFIKKVHIWCTQAKKICFNCRLSVEEGTSIESILNHLESSSVNFVNFGIGTKHQLTDLLPDQSVNIATRQDFPLVSGNTGDQTGDLLSLFYDSKSAQRLRLPKSA